jgi:hypothetical protein
MNINPSAISTLANNLDDTTTTPSRAKEARKQDEISPSPQRVFTPPSAGVPLIGTSTVDGANHHPFIFGERREQGNVLNITKFFARKKSNPTSAKKSTASHTTTLTSHSSSQSTATNTAFNTTSEPGTIEGATNNILESTTLDNDHGERAAVEVVRPLSLLHLSTCAAVRSALNNISVLTTMDDTPSEQTVVEAVQPQSPPQSLTRTTGRTSSVDAEMGDSTPLSRVKLVPLQKSLYKHTPKPSRSVAFSPTNKVCLLDKEGPATNVSVTTDITLHAQDPPVPVNHQFKTVFEISVRIGPNSA